MNTTYPKNPFCLEPINVLAKFFGRKKETRRALSFLHRGQCVSIVGPAKIGKTSFLSHVAHPYVCAKHRLATECLFVHLDSHFLVDFSEGECYLRIREEVIRQIKSTVAVDRDVGTQLEKSVRATSSRTAHYGLRTLFRSAQACGLKLVIALDNLDALNQNCFLGLEFFSALRSYHIYDMAYLAASQSPLRLDPECPGSPFFNIFQQIPIGLFTEGESRQLTVTLLDLAGVKFPDFVTNCILELGRNEPYRLQRAGHIAFQVWQKNYGDLQVKHCEEIKQQFEGVKV